MDAKEYFPFPEFRPGQEKLLHDIADALWETRNVIVQAPTGVGKSPVAIAFADCTGSIGGPNNEFHGSMIYTATIQLQRQYEQYQKAMSVMGKANFECLRTLEESCRTGNDQTLPCPHSPTTNYDYAVSPAAVSKSRGELYWKTGQKCPYWDGKTKAMNSDVVIANYAYAILELNKVRDFGKKSLAIYDEAHNIAKKVQDALRVTFNDSDMSKKRLSVGKISEYSGRNIRDWKAYVDKLGEKIGEKIGRINGNDLATLRRVQALEDMLTNVKRVEMAIEKSPTNWVVDHNPEKGSVEFIPVDVSNYTNQLLYQHSGSKIFMSATILDPELFARFMGIKDYKYIEADSTIPVNQRLIKKSFAGSMSVTGGQRKRTLPHLARKIDELAALHSHEKGIIHTVSRSNAEEIIKRCNPATQNRLLYVENSKMIPVIMRKHLASPNTIIVAPAMREGVDLVGDQARFQILAKTPYPNLGDPAIEAMKNKDPDWYAWQTAIETIQTIGRAVRGPEDEAVAYLVDTSFDFFLKQNARILPSWFTDAIVS